MTSDRYLGLVGLSVCTVYHSSSTVPQQSRVLLVQYHFDRLKRLYGYNSSLPSNSYHSYVLISHVTVEFAPLQTHLVKGRRTI